MDLLSAVISLTLLVSVSGNYFIAAPNTMRPETDFGVEVRYTGDGTVNVEVTLGIVKQTPLVTKTEAVTDGRRLITLAIPQVVPDGTYTLTVVGRSPSNVEVFRNSSVIQLEADNSLLLVQTDKPIYKPMQEVRFRIVCVDQNLKPRTTPTDISIFDKTNTKLEEWLAQEGDRGVIERSYTLSDMPVLGEWKIQVKNQFSETEKMFTVDKYVLPKFEVTAESDVTDTVREESGEINIKVMAKYTFGKPVVGKATFIIGEGRNFKTVAAAMTQAGAGVHTQKFTIEELREYMWGSTLQIVVNVTESTTAVTQTSNEVAIKVHNSRITFEFLPASSQVYHPGLPVYLEVKAYDVIQKQPAHVGAVVEFTTNSRSMNATTTIDSQGIARQSFDIPLTPTVNYLSFTANLKDKDNRVKMSAYHSPQSYQTKLNTMITLEVTSTQPINGGSFDIEVRTSGTVSGVTYLVLARGEVVQSGEVSMSGLSGSAAIISSRDMTPSAQIIVYAIVTDGEVVEVIADSAEVQVTGLFDNEVALTFSSVEARTGEAIDVTITTEPDSSYYILVVDQSVLLLGTGNDLTQSGVVRDMSKFQLGETPNYNGQPEPHGGIMGDVIMPGPQQDDVPTSAGQLFKVQGLVYMSGITVEMMKRREIFPVMAQADDGIMFKNAEADMAGAPMASSPSGAKTEYAEVGNARRFFPEAWMWTGGMMNGQSSLTRTETVPDTITSWVATAFSVSDSKGLAITSQSTELRAFKPFFASMTLPYAIKRGEIFPLRVTLFNYMETNTKVKVTLKRSEDFGIMEKDADGKTTVMSKDVVVEVEVQKDVPYGLIFNISANKLGNVKLHVLAQPEDSTREKGDNLERIVLVKPEGIIKRQVEGETVEIDPSSPQTFAKTVPLPFPQTVVNGSKRIEVKVTGDVMGPTVEGLEKLIRIPTGCGEQNMITVVPNIVVYNYLKAVGRDTNTLLDRAVANMKTGYARELTFKLDDGSFSAFGQSDVNGSTWLTAFVMKSFSQARTKITIDDKIMKGAFNWLKMRQNGDGTFKESGRVIHTEMQGGSTGEYATTAFLYIALKESEHYISETDRYILTSSQTYLETIAGMLTRLYDKAIVAYALSLAGSNVATTLLQQIEDSGQKPWEQTGATEAPVEPMPVDNPEGRQAMIMPRPKPRPTSSAIETWSYVLLARAVRQEISLGQPIMKWLINNQNELGGFFSTQDTMIGLQALAEYAALVYTSPGTDIELNVRSNTGESHQFLVQADKLLLLQSYRFSEDTTFLEMEGTGQGLAIVKIAWQYNVLEDQKSQTDKSISVTVDTEKVNDDLYRITTCFKSDNPDMGMILLDVEKQTEMSLGNLNDLERDRNIRKVEDKEGHLYLYFNEAKSTPQCSSMNMQRDAPIMNLQAASVKATVYYSPDIEEEISYTISGAPLVDICEVCFANTCPIHCPAKDACQNCGNNCPSSCDTSGAPLWKMDAMLLSLGICLLFSLIMAI